MRKILILSTIFILLSPSMMTITDQVQSQYNVYNKNLNDINKNKMSNSLSLIKNLPSDFNFNPEDIELKDDAFHGENSMNFVEWWYFDAIFDESYSIQLTVYIFDILSKKFIITGVNAYREGINILSRENYYIFNELDVSAEIPIVTIDGKQLLKGYIDEVSGNWIYDVTMDFNDATVDLEFIGKSKGWKGNLSIGGWAVILPKAEVSGKIILYGTEYNVEGIGYHDHNWGLNVLNTLKLGWYWGRINLDNLTIVWFKILNSWFNSETLCVISKDNGEYINIDPSEIYFSTDDYRLDTIWWVPNSFILKVDVKDIFFAIVMNTIAMDSDYKIRGHYWRYHLDCYGQVIIDNETKDISSTQIAEFMRFV